MSSPEAGFQFPDQEWDLNAAVAKSLQSCPTLCDPIDRQPTRLPRPWDSPGKNTGVGRHFLLQCMKVKSQSEVTQLCPTLSDPVDCSLPGSSVHGIFQTKSTGVGCHCSSLQYRGQKSGNNLRANRQMTDSTFFQNSPSL